MSAPKSRKPAILATGFMLAAASLGGARAAAASSRADALFASKSPTGQVIATSNPAPKSPSKSEWQQTAQDAWEKTRQAAPGMQLPQTPPKFIFRKVSAQEAREMDDVPDQLTVGPLYIVRTRDTIECRYAAGDAPTLDQVRYAVFISDFQGWLDRAPPLGNGFVTKEEILDFFSHAVLPPPLAAPTVGHLKVAALVYAMGGVDAFQSALTGGHLTDSAITGAIDLHLGPGACRAVLQGPLVTGKSETQTMTRILLSPQFELEKFAGFMNAFSLDPYLFQTRNPLTKKPATLGEIISNSEPP